jgi:hypothetical protein
MEEKRYLACVNCDDAIQICGKDIMPVNVINFLGLHVHGKDDDKHLLMCFEHEYVYNNSKLSNKEWD